MPNLHRLKGRTWRAEDGEVAGARANVPVGKNLGAFIRACVRTLGKEPAAILAAVSRHWPDEPTPVGRPRKNAETAE